MLFMFARILSRAIMFRQMSRLAKHFWRKQAVWLIRSVFGLLTKQSSTDHKNIVQLRPGFIPTCQISLHLSCVTNSAFKTSFAPIIFIEYKTYHRVICLQELVQKVRWWIIISTIFIKQNLTKNQIQLSKSAHIYQLTVPILRSFLGVNRLRPSHLAI